MLLSRPADSCISILLMISRGVVAPRQADWERKVPFLENECLNGL